MGVLGVVSRSGRQDILGVRCLRVWAEGHEKDSAHSDRQDRRAGKKVGDEEAQNELVTSYRHQRHLGHKMRLLCHMFYHNTEDKNKCTTGKKQQMLGRGFSHMAPNVRDVGD
ncbi:hypothetical protein J6590_063074 [Homalodisca vitripennis]|nr:hypothetical protein J6590_063074 [Homalodisca vitripennis]